MDWFPKLETLAYIAVGWVGVKLIATTTAYYTDLIGWTEGLHEHGILHVIELKEVSVAVTVSVIVLPVLIKAFMDFVIKRKGKADTLSREP
jgi:predicted tellurium resistance membrane protein TerC